MRLRVATRRSALALAQTRMMCRALESRWPGLVVSEVQIVTEGDRIQDRSLAEVGGKGLFIKELESALLEGRADVAVHSMKDLPADVAPGLRVAAVPERESPWDLMVTVDGRALADLPQGARIGTSSLRRSVQLRAVRPDVSIEMLRGNVDTRLRRVRDGDFDAVILAEAGVRRLGITVQAFRLEGAVIPAVAQGALALEARVDDAQVHAWLAPFDHAQSAVCTQAERAVMRGVEGSCVTPLGALAVLTSSELTMRGFLATPDGSAFVKASVSGPVDQPEALGHSLAVRLRQALAAR